MVKIKEPPGLRASMVSARRVIQIKDICVLAGTYLIRYGLRTLLPALALTLTMLAGSKALGGQESALPFTPLFLASLLVLAGFGLKYVPKLFSKKQLTTAEARGFDQLELYRQARLPVLLDQLEKMVYRHEAKLTSTQETCDAEDRLIQQRREEIATHMEGISQDTLNWLGADRGSELVDPLVWHRPLTDSVEASRSGFLISAHYGLTEPLSETATLAATGYDFSLLTDYLDGACFHISDSKLKEQYTGHPVIRAALKDCKTGKRKLPRYLRPTAWTRESDILYSVSQFWNATTEKLWRSGICREVMVRSGRAFSEIDSAYPKALITASSFLRPGDSDNAYHRRFPGLPDMLRDQGQQVLQSVLGNNRGDAFEMIDRMKMHSVIRAFTLRLSYDPEYVCGMIAPGFFEDAKELAAKEETIVKIKRYIDEIATEQEALASFAALSERTPLEIRALRVAWHVNIHGFQERKEGAIEDILREKESLSERLYYVRLHHSLALLDRKEYQHLLDAVAFGAKDN